MRAFCFVVGRLLCAVKVDSVVEVFPLLAIHPGLRRYRPPFLGWSQAHRVLYPVFKLPGVADRGEYRYMILLESGGRRYMSPVTGSEGVRELDSAAFFADSTRCEFSEIDLVVLTENFFKSMV